MAALAILLSPLRAAVGFALPPRCPGCGLVVDGDHRFCADCWGRLDWLAGPACGQCAVRLPHAGADRCARCMADPPAFDVARAAVAYGPLARDLVLKLKYGRRPGLAHTFARLMTSPGADERDRLVVPVPLHRWRLWRRAYNQAGLIGRALAGRAGAQFSPDLLQRVKPTPVLRGMGPRARRDAVRGAFRVNDGVRLDGKRILLVDDVFTTGSTAHACARALKRAGAAHVEVRVWARVLRDDPGEF